MKNSFVANYSVISKYRSELMGIAAILIIFSHSNTMIDYDKYSYLLYYVMGQTNIGVDIFLFMSGIGLYFSFSNSKYNFKQYYIKRILNVYVIYLLISFPLFLFNAIKFGNTVTGFFLDWSGVAFCLGKRYIYKNHGAWYIMFIMLMYFIYPLIFKTQKFFEKKKMDLMLLTVFILIYIALCSLLLVNCESAFIKYEVALTRVPVFMIGSYTGKLVYNKEKFGVGTYLTIVFGIIISVFLAYLNLPFVSSRFNKMLMAVAICLIYSMLRSLINLEIIGKLLSFIGQMSLELYLTHNLMNQLLFKQGHSDNAIQFLIIVAVSFLISIPISRFRLRLVSEYDKKIKNKPLLYNTNL